MRNPAAPALLSLLFLGSSACNGCKGQTTNGRMHVAVSIFPIFDLTRRVAGPDADVALLLPPGHNEHHFDPTPKEVEEVSRAQVGVMVGLGLDPWMEKLLRDAAPTAKVLKVGDRVPTLTIDNEMVGSEEADKELAKLGKGDDPGHEKGALDPHVWLDPTRARLIVKAIAEELARADSAHANAYRARAAEIDTSLDALDKEIEKTTASWKTRELITFHGSFGYFADRYHLNIAAVIEPIPGSTPTGEYIEAVLKVVSARKVPALYSEPQLDPRPAKTLADAAHLPLGVLDPVGGGAETDSYEKMLRFDTAALDKYLK